MRYLLPIAALLVLAGCGGASEKHPPAQRDAATAARPPHAPELVAFQLNGGVLSATLDTVTVRTDGTTRADKRYGGAGRRFADFRLRSTVLRRLRAALGRLPARTPAVGTGDRSGATYLLRYRGRTYVARQGAVPASLRPAVSTLRSIVEGGGRGGPVHEVRQAPA
jgi:hypothetical protein